ncbi:MAG: protein kinase [Actinobacteria bacterium]|nr:protein kinase [Actinomycetota bacterium]
MTGTVDSEERVIGDRYRLHEPLGSGGMGTVWRGEDCVLGRIVAIKEVTFPPGVSGADREVLRERIRREARAAAQLDHPGAVAVHDVVEEGLATYLVMQYVPARTLSEAIRRDGPMSPHHAAQVGLAVLGVLRAAHARGIVHRDVKPSNVLLSTADDAPRGRVFLTDFGIASSPGESSLTTTGLVVGSPSYIAPERARGDQPAPASDLWSLGATLFTAVEGHPPYDAGDPMMTLTAVMVGEHAPYVRAGSLQPVIARLLERDPARRITAEQLESALSVIATSPDNESTPALPWSPGAVDPDASAGTAVLHVGARSPGGEPARPADPESEVHPPAGPSTASRSVPRVPRRPVVAGDPAVGRPSRGHGHRRAKRLAWAGLATAVIAGLAVPIVRVADREPAAGRAVPGVADQPADTSGDTPAADQSTVQPGLPPLPATADTPSKQLRETITALDDLATSDPDVVGPEADEVLASLRRVELLDGAQRRSAAIVAATSVGDALVADELDPDVGRRVQEVLDNVARPERFIDIVALVDVDPLAIGPGGPRLFESLFALDHSVPADQAATRAAALLERVKDGAERGELSAAFETAAVPTLEELADPTAYRALREFTADVERDPDRIGPAERQVLASLRDLGRLPVFDQGNAALELLALVRQEDRVLPAFRDRAIPVLVPLVR